MSVQNRMQICGETTRYLKQIFERYESNDGTVSESLIRSILNGMGLYPTHSQVAELVNRACEYSGGRIPNDQITFGEFCILVTELKEQYRRHIPSLTPRSLLREKAIYQASEERRFKRKFLVFLGGSCNPTTWRDDEAIPYFKKHGITFYNPQVRSWKPELVEIEVFAKQTAEILFFVIDNQTRSTASMVEVAYLAGCGRQLILVIRKFNQPVVIHGEKLVKSELEDLERSHTYLIDLVERMSIPVFTEIKSALDCTKIVLDNNIRVCELSVEHGAHPVKYPHIRVANELMQIKTAFSTQDTGGRGWLTCRDVRLAFKTLTDEDLPTGVPTSADGDGAYTFEQFCCLLAEYRYKRKAILQRMINELIRIPHRFANWSRGRTERPLSDMRRYDVFLGGSCGVTRWRDEVAAPILLKNGVSYYNPQLGGWNTHYIPLEAAFKNSCRLLLFVITEDTRAVTSMLEAAYFIGQACNVVLCIQDIKRGLRIDGDQVSDTAAIDYNRARTYLTDLANRDGVPVLSDIGEAVQKAVKILKASRTSDYVDSI